MLNGHALPQHGMCIIPGLFDREAVLARGAQACAAAAAATTSIRSGGAAAAGAFNVNDDKFTVEWKPEVVVGGELNDTDPLVVAILDAVVLEPTTVNGGSQVKGSEAARLVRSAARRSTAVLQAQAWGAVVAMPAATRQAIHPDAVSSHAALWLRLPCLLSRLHLP